MTSEGGDFIVIAIVGCLMVIEVVRENSEPLPVGQCRISVSTIRFRLVDGRLFTTGRRLRCLFLRCRWFWGWRGSSNSRSTSRDTVIGASATAAAGGRFGGGTLSRSGWYR